MIGGVCKEILFIFSRLNLDTLRTQPLREDKHCLNCGAEVPERFCTHCGQENTERHESFAHLVQHFVADVVHYDSQFLKTLKYLLFRPGKLTGEYFAGRRVAYVNPIKLYIFISFVFFLVYALTHPVSHEENGQKGLNIQLTKEDSAELAQNPLDDFRKYKSVKEYDSVQASLPPGERHGFWKRLSVRRSVYFLTTGNLNESFAELFSHNLPKLMFILLPLFALLMKLMYGKKQWYYADHAIFSLHVHCFSFVLLLVTLMLDRWLGGQFTSVGVVIIVLYLIQALKYVYRQSFAKSLLKGLLLSVSYTFVMFVVFAAFALLAFTIFL